LRRKDREINDPAEWREILDRADSCRIGFAAGNEPYVVAMNFGYRWTDRLTLYFHCAREGRKLDFLSKNDRVCFQLDADRKIVSGEEACRWSMEYRSLAGTGRMVRVSDPGERIDGLNRILVHYGGAEQTEYGASALEAVLILRLDVETFSGKRQPGRLTA
jgi:uncharacterized protein